VADHENLIFDMAELIMLEPIDDPSPRSAPPRGVSVAYGEYLATSVALCADCHTPRGGIRESHDRSKPFAGDATPPAGFPRNPRNLTPDPETGIGYWTEAEFIQALRTGVTPAGYRLDPFMPWQQFRRMTDDDLRAIWLYLQSLAPIRSEIPRVQR
jgi:hypothetical protein